MKLSKIAVNLVRKFAPTIAAGLGGPVAGQAVNVIADALGIPKATATEVENALSLATPAQLAVIKAADQKFATDMAALDVDVFKLETADTQNARAMAIVNMWPQIVLSTIFIVGYFGLVYMLFSGQVKIDTSIRDMANILIGVMTANIPQIMAFWFGSSHGSKTKPKD